MYKRQSTDNTPINLDIESGTGKATVEGVIGGTANRTLGTIAINDATDDGTGEIELNSIGAGGVGSGAITVGHATTDKITLDGTVYKTGNALFTAKTGETIDMSAAATFTLSNKTLEFATGTVKLADAANLTVGTGNGAITIHSIEGTSHEDISLTSTGTIKPGTIGATLVSGINDITITGPSTLTGDITAAGDGTADASVVNFNGAVIIDGAITVDTDRVAADGSGND